MAPRPRGGGKTPHHHLRADNDVWPQFVANAERVDSDASTVLNAFMRWFNRQPGAKLPHRPDTPLSRAEHNTLEAVANQRELLDTWWGNLADDDRALFLAHRRDRDLPADVVDRVVASGQIVIGGCWPDSGQPARYFLPRYLGDFLAKRAADLGR